MPWRHLSRAERICLVVLLATLAGSPLLPPIAQDQAYHAFADPRSLFGIPHAADVLSNLAFALVGAFGIARLRSTHRITLSPATEASLWCVAVGFVLTAAGSSWYHHAPNDASLAWDRLPMTLVFSGVIGTALAERAGQRIARVALALLIAVGVISIVHWRLSGNLSLYLLLQYGGIAALLALILATRRGDDPFPWGWVIGWYLLAKLFELGDAWVWHATNGLFAGHAIKHVTAALAGAAIFTPLRATR